MKADEGGGFLPSHGWGARMGNKRSSSPTPWPASFFCSLNEGIKRALSLRPQGLSRCGVDGGTAVRTGDKEMGYKPQKILQSKTTDKILNSPISTVEPKHQRSTYAVCSRLGQQRLPLSKTWRWSKKLLKTAEERRRREAKQS